MSPQYLEEVYAYEFTRWQHLNGTQSKVCTISCASYFHCQCILDCKTELATTRTCFFGQHSSYIKQPVKTVITQQQPFLLWQKCKFQKYRVTTTDRTKF